MELTEIFEDVPDFRVLGRTSYKLSELLIISLCAVLGGAEDYEEIAEYGRQKEDFLRTFLDLDHGIPSHDTFTRVFRFLDKEAFSRCLYRWSEEIVTSLDALQINIDGKVLRATGKRGKRTSGLCLVNAWVANHCLSLGQVKVDAKSNEKTAIPTIIEDIDIAGSLVSIDAMGTHSKFAQQIRSKGADYLLALKKNQKSLYEQVSDWLERHHDTLEKYTETDYVGGRIETRTTWLCQDLRWLNALEQWPDCASIIMTRYERSFKNGKDDSSSKTRFYISSAKYKAQQFNTAVRSHWSIENQLHWYLDVVFMEDKQRVREGNGPENMATLRKLSLQLLMQQKTKGISMKKLRKRAAWNDEFLIKTILQMGKLF
ncbi:MAG: ISAs1 family transposase [Bacteroidota bacterium]